MVLIYEVNQLRYSKKLLPTKIAKKPIIRNREILKRVGFKSLIISDLCFSISFMIFCFKVCIIVINQKNYLNHSTEKPEKIAKNVILFQHFLNNFLNLAILILKIQILFPQLFPEVVYISD